MCCASGRPWGRGWLLPCSWAGGLGSTWHLCFVGAAFGYLPISCNALPALIPSLLLIKVDLFFKVMLKVTFAVRLSTLNGSLLVSKSSFFILLVWLAAQPGSPWLAICTSASPQTDSRDSGSAGGKVTPHPAWASGQLAASSPWLQLGWGGGGFPKPQMELKAQRGQAASQGHTALGRQSCGLNSGLWVQHSLACDVRSPGWGPWAY